MLEEQAILDEY
jgi:hypothetical protein